MTPVKPEKFTPVDLMQRADELKRLQWGMFICWSFSTFSGKEWTTGVGDVSFFKATDVDTDQWARTAKEAGMGYILFLAKHHDGFCLWDTKTTDRKITKAPLGRDVLAELRTSCDRYGLRLALYFSEGDWTWPGAKDGALGGSGQDAVREKAQLTELLGNYGPIEYLWVDHAAGTGGLSHAEFVAHCKALQPGCFVGFNHGDQTDADIRLGEEGKPGSLEDQTAAGPHMRETAGLNYLLAEFTYPILPKHKGGAMWFYSLPEHDELCHPAEKLYRDYLGAVQYGNLFSLDVGPDYNGKLRDIDVRTLRQVGAMIRSQSADFRGTSCIAADGVRRVRVLNYPDCIELANDETRVVLGYHVGGRVLHYAWRGKEALYLHPAEADWQTAAGRENPEASAGRFDIGPEHLVPPRAALWSGAWTAEVIGPRAARLTSLPDPATGVQLVREFRLAATGSHLACTQTIRNISGEHKRWCHWSRTLACHGGIAVVPLTPEFGKFPNGYLMYTPGQTPAIGFRPVDPHIRERDGFLEILGVPANPKLGFDSHAGWLAYQMPHDLLFVKRFATYPERVYNEVAGLTISIWYPATDVVPAVELEPIGPCENLAPGANASFTEHWWLLENPFPENGASLDLKALAGKVAKSCHANKE